MESLQQSDFSNALNLLAEMSANRRKSILNHRSKFPSSPYVKVYTPPGILITKQD